MVGGYPLRKTAPPWGSLTVPPCAVTMMTPGVIAAEAAAVKVPVLIAVGERDVCPEPHAEPTAYRGSSDVSLFIAPRMAHMHNFASTRALLWSRIASWSRRVAAG
jgi:pimeloyl-ACP methyl ester carboxylesterase